MNNAILPPTAIPLIAAVERDDALAEEEEESPLLDDIGGNVRGVLVDEIGSNEGVTVSVGDTGIRVDS